MQHAAPDSIDTPWPAPRTAWYAVLVLNVAYLFSYLDRQILSMLVTPIKADLALDDTQVSLLHGLAFAICYTVLGVWPIGRWADTGNRRNIVAGGVFLWSVMTALCGRASNYLGLFLARVGVGVGEAALTPVAYSLLADYFPPEKRGRALGLFSMGIYFGIGAATMITGLLVQAIGESPTVLLPLVGEVRSWQAPFLLLGPPGILVALWLLTLREPERRGAAPQSPPFAAVIAQMRRHAAFYLPHTFGVSLLTMLFNALAFWMPAHLKRVHALTPVEIAFSFGPIIVIAGSLGVVAGGMLADHWRKAGKQDAELLVGLSSTLILLPFAIATFVVTDVQLAIALMGPMLFFACFPFGAAAGAVQLVTPNQLRARVSALYLMVINLTGIGFGATAAALISDHVLHDERRIGDGVAIVAAVGLPLAAVLLGKARRHYRAMQAR
jgi:MFS family permease